MLPILFAKGAIKMWSLTNWTKHIHKYAIKLVEKLSAYTQLQLNNY